jgi:hypothetical protein
MRDVTYCNECGGRLNLYVVGVCPQCDYDLTGVDEERDRREERSLRGADSPREGTEA